MSFPRVVLAGLLAGGLGSSAPAGLIRGVLIDKECSSKAELRLVPGPRLEGGMVVAEAHDRECALMPQCQKSGYGVFTHDNKFLAFDAAGNRMALAALKASKKLVDLQVEVEGQVEGNTIKVSSLKLLP